MIAQTGGRGRAFAMRAVAVVAAPLVFFAIMELALALIGFGGRPALFVASPDWPDKLEANPDVVLRYFPGRKTDLAIAPIPFDAQKDPESFRLVVQGGSTAAGFPFGRWGGLAGMLGDRLEAARPAQTIEVISTAMAAVNSYTLLDFVDEIIAIEPDAVLLYVGHNEYLGIFGAGSAITPQRSRRATRMHLALARLRVYQLIDLLIPSAAEAARRAESGPGRERDTLMARAASSAEIPFGSAVYQEGLLQFEENLDAILSRYAQAGISVFVGTLASNQADQPPFAGAPVRQAEGPAYQAMRAQARQLQERGDLEGARAVLEQLVARHPLAAAGWYELAQLDRATGHVDAARRGYRKAKDYDRLRFRAPEAMNAIVRDRAQAHGTHVVDVQARLAANSALGVVGQEMMLEHLHPNARGYFLLADAYYDALESVGLFGTVPADPAPTRAEALRDMPITAIDRLNAAQRVREIRADVPFRASRIAAPYPETRGPIEALAERVYQDPSQWLMAMEGLLQLHLRHQRFALACVVARVTAQALPWEAAPNLAAARLLERGGRLRQAVRYYHRAHRADPDDPATLRRFDRIRERLGIAFAKGEEKVQ